MKWFFTAIHQSLSPLLAYRWAYALPIATLLLPATIYAVRMPDTFQARAVVRVREMTTGDYGSRLPTEQGVQAFATVATVRDRLITTRTLQSVLPVLDPTIPVDDAVALDRLRDRIEFERLSDYSFSIAISDTSADRASSATNVLLKTFFEGEKEPLLRRARDRRSFYEREAEGASRIHASASRVLREYRSVHASSLPELKDIIAGEITAQRAEARMQAQLTGAARRRTDFLSEQIARGGATTSNSPAVRLTSAEEKRLEQQLTQQQTLLSTANKQLAEARTRHTEKMPDVIGLRTAVSGLKADLEATVAALDAARKRATASASNRQAQQGAQALTLLRQLHAESLEAVRVASESHAAVLQQIKALEGRLAKIPATNAGLAPLEEALAEADARRDALQASAGAAAEREEYLSASRAEDVTPYQVAQWAVPPAKPSGPKRLAVLGTAVALGVLLGYGLMLLRRRFKDEVVTTTEQMTLLIPDAFVVCVPLLESGRKRDRLRWRELIPATWVACCLGLTLWTLAAHKGLMIAPPWLQELMGRSA